MVTGTDTSPGVTPSASGISLQHHTYSILTWQLRQTWSVFPDQRPNQSPRVALHWPEGAMFLTVGQSLRPEQEKAFLGQTSEFPPHLPAEGGVSNSRRAGL